MKPRREVAVIGVGMTPFGKFPDRSTREMGEEALWEAMTDAGARPKDIEVAYGGYVGMFMDLPMMAVQVALVDPDGHTRIYMRLPWNRMFEIALELAG